MQIRRSVSFFTNSIVPPIFFFKSETTITCTGTSRKVNVNAVLTSILAQIVKKAMCLMTTTQYNSNNSLTPEFKWEIIWMNSSTYRPRLKKDIWSKLQLWPKIKHQDRHNLKSAPKFSADPRSTVFSKSANPLDLRQKSTIRALFKAKSVDPKTYSKGRSYNPRQKSWDMKQVLPSPHFQCW